MSYDEWGLAAAMKTAMAQAWDEGYEAGSYDTREFDAVTESRVDYDDYEDTPNPYQDEP